MADKASSSPGSKCPYWLLDDSEECNMFNNGGVYIPMPEHISMFCLTSQHVRCHQYIKGYELKMTQEKGKEKNDRIVDERRKFHRYPEQLYLKLFVYDTTIKPSKVTNFKAKTLDVSLGGFRIESPRELTTGSVVGFESDDDISSHSMSGIGEVRWCKPSKKPDNFEFGIAFPILIQSRD